MMYVKPSEVSEYDVVIDVRTPAEYKTSHIPGSVNIPASRINAASDDIDSVGRNILLTCRTDSRSSTIAQNLQTKGIRVEVLKGGVNAYSAEYDMEEGRDTWSLQRQVRFGAGSLVALGTILGATVSPWFLAISGFVGVGLMYAGVTDTCGMTIALRRAPWNTKQYDLSEALQELRDKA